MVECGGLENRCPAKTGPWVRIPLSPPAFRRRQGYGGQVAFFKDFNFRTRYDWKFNAKKELLRAPFYIFF